MYSVGIGHEAEIWSILYAPGSYMGAFFGPILYAPGSDLLQHSPPSSRTAHDLSFVRFHPFPLNWAPSVGLGTWDGAHCGTPIAITSPTKVHGSQDAGTYLEKVKKNKEGY